MSDDIQHKQSGEIQGDEAFAVQGTPSNGSQDDAAGAVKTDSFHDIEHNPSWTWLRVIISILIVLPQPLIAFAYLVGSPVFPDNMGFLGAIFPVIPPLLVIFLLIFVNTIGLYTKMAYKAEIAALVLFALLTVNHFYVTSKYVNSGLSGLSYESDTAAVLARENLAQNLSAYRPFTGTEISRLDEPSTLQFPANGILPRVDSATALLPLASSFVTATYPESTVSVQWEVENDDALYEEDFSNYSPYENAVFQYNNSSTGFENLALGYSDIFFGTKADAGQEEMARAIGVEFEYTPIGREGFVFLVNSSNPVDSLTIDQVKGIYSGKITNWREVGGNDEPIEAYQRNSNSGSQSMMVRFMGDTPLADPPEELRSQSMGGLVSQVASYDNGAGAIGYSFRYYATDLVGTYDIKLLAIEGVEPTPENISNNTYPITGDFYAVTVDGVLDSADSNAGDSRVKNASDQNASGRNGSAKTDTRRIENVRRLIEWIRGPQGQDLVVKSGYAPIED